MNEIRICGLKVQAFIGVPDAERQHSQEILIDLVIEPLVPFAETADDISRTVDYAAVAERVRAVVTARPRRLIETLAAELSSMVVTEFAARSATVAIRKFILPDTDYVAVRHQSRRPGSQA